MKEVWKAVKGYEGFYEVSTYGRVRSIDRYTEPEGRGSYFRKGKALKQVDDGGGYLQVCLHAHGKQKSKKVHKLVTDAFLKPDPSRKDINHIDGIKTNNEITNLERATRSENVKHAFKNGLKSHKGEKNTAAKLTNEDVDAIRLCKSSGMPSRAIAILFDVYKSTILRIWNGKNWNHLPA